MDSKSDPVLECLKHLPLPFSSLCQLQNFSSLLMNIESNESYVRDSEMIYSKEILGALGIDLFEWMLNIHPEATVPSSEILSETCIFHIIETLDIARFPRNHISLLNGPIIPVLFEDIQFADATSDSEVSIDVFGSMVTLDQLPMENLRFGSFNEMIVCHELCPVSDTFKSFPVPIVLDRGNVDTHYAIVMNSFAVVMEHPLSTSDGIYLDWPLWEEDKRKTYQSFIVHNILKEIDPCTDYFHHNAVNSGLLVLDFVFDNDVSKVVNTKEGKLTLDLILGGISFPDNESEFNSDQLVKNGTFNMGNVEPLPHINTEEVLHLSEHISEFNDLIFFLNLQSGTSNEMGKSSEIHHVSSSDDLACAPIVNRTGQWVVHLFEVHLTDNIVFIMDYFRKCLFSMIGNKIDLILLHCPSLLEDNYGFLNISEKMLHDIMRKPSTETTHFVGGSEQNKVLKSMCVIKRISWCLCFYGVYPAHQNFEKLLKFHRDLYSPFHCLYSLVENAADGIEKDIVKSHPSLSAIKDILISSPQSSKVLIVTEMIFWNQLRLLLASMGLLYHDLGSERQCKSQVDKYCLNELIHTVDNLLRSFNYLLISYKHVSETFPFNKFNIIVEYGGSWNSSRLPRTLQSTEVHNLYFVKLDLVTHKFINDGKYSSEIDYDDEDAMRMCSLEHLNIDSDRSSTYDSVSLACTSSKSIPLLKSVDNVQIGSLKFSETVIVVNTRNIDKEMLVSKRETYQRILSLEKKGAQVVERDLTMHVDIIISPTVCVVWYDCNNIGKNTSLQNASSFLSESVDNIAANIFASLSFCFKNCILIFEGDLSFHSSIMEYSDVLYAAAASLGIDLQIFFSHSSDMTSQILLCCIGHASISNGAILSRFPESETLAEAFLTKFPSFNVFIAISVLSSVKVLVDYFNWTSERRVLEAKNYHVHDENIILFNLLCGYGDMDNSISGITDCSSSTSHDPNAGNLHFSVASRRKKRKLTGNSGHCEIAMSADGLVNVSPLEKFYGSEIPTLPSTKTVEYCIEKYKTFSDSKQPCFYGDYVIQSDRQHKNFVDGFDENFSPVAEHTYFPRDIFDIEMPTTKSCKDMTSACVTDSYPDFSLVIGADVKDSSGFGNGNDIPVVDHVDMFQKELRSLQFVRPDHTRTAFSDAVYSSHPVVGSSWTTEFLNRAREKHKVRQKSSRNSYASSCQNSERLSGYSKRRSPSYIDLFRYRGVPTRARGTCSKKSWLPNSDSSMNSGNDSVLPSTLTPLDKRSKKALKFTVNGNGNQSKLVWSNGDGHRRI